MAKEKSFEDLAVRADGRREKKISVGRNRDGSIKRRSIYGTPEELEAKLDDIKVRKRKKLDISKDYSLGEVAEEWFDIEHRPSYESAEPSDSSIQYHASLYKHLFGSSISLRKITEITAMEIDEHLKGLGKTRTAQVHKNMLNQVFRFAERKKNIIGREVGDNPMRDVESVGYKAATKRTTTELEEIAIASAKLEPIDKAYLYFILFGGARPGEPYALMHCGNRSDISLQSRTYSITKNWKAPRNQGFIKETPKTDAGNRVNPMITPLYNAVAEAMDVAEGIHLFTKKDGELMSKIGSRRMWERILRQLNLAVYTPRDPNPIQDLTRNVLRHTCATFMAAANVPASITQRFMGHNSPVITLGIYTHISVFNRYKHSPLFNYYTEFHDLYEAAR